MWRTHLKKDCALANGHCIIHKPSDHALKDAYINIRGSGLIERICQHGIGHPDPDALDYLLANGYDRATGLHGCDGCCGKNDYAL